MHISLEYRVIRKMTCHDKIHSDSFCLIKISRKFLAKTNISIFFHVKKVYNSNIHFNTDI